MSKEDMYSLSNICGLLLRKMPDLKIFALLYKSQVCCQTLNIGSAVDIRLFNAPSTYSF
jgi:hypothetical protein